MALMGATHMDVNAMKKARIITVTGTMRVHMAHVVAMYVSSRLFHLKNNLMTCQNCRMMDVVDIQVVAMPQIMQIKGFLMMLLSLSGQGARMQRLSGRASTDMKVERSSEKNIIYIFFIYVSVSGGYAYRLCKVPTDGVIGITEKCFQNGHLEFYGPYTWLMYVEDENSAGEITMQRSAMRTTEGTTPEGSEWTKINAPTEGELGDQFPAQGWGIKDYVQVPESLETGQYILSFRWDSQHTPQVWHSCANIEIV